jgi:hypothetical protein
MAKLCTQLSTAEVCFNDGTLNQTLIAHYEYGKDADGFTILVATRFTDAEGAPVDTSAGTVTAGACALTPPDVEYSKLCDVQADGTIVEFFRRTITSFDSVGVATVTVTDFELDKVTEYTVAGDVTVCNEDCDPATALGTLSSWGNPAP